MKPFSSKIKTVLIVLGITALGLFTCWGIILLKGVIMSS